MIRFFAAVVLTLSLATVPPTHAQGAEGPPGVPPSDVDLAHLSPAHAMAEAMAAMRAGDWALAKDLGDAAGPLGRDVIDWHWLRSGLGTFDEALDFIERRGDWPGLPYLKAQMEKTLPIDGRADDVLFFFGDDVPDTGNGSVALVSAYARAGQEGDAEAQAVQAWLSLSLSAATEAQLFDRYGPILEPLDPARLDHALWRGWRSAARRAVARIGDEDLSALASARMALRAVASSAADLVEAVPEALADDPGLAYEQFRWLMAKGQRDEAAEFMIARSVTAEKLGKPEPWARARRDLAREKMRAADHATAYALAASHHLAEGADYADLEWLSGYLALRYLDAPDKALEHFRHFRAAVDTPISLGRAGYWLGRAHEALGQNTAAAEAYAFGAGYQTSFYGLLSAERIGLPLDDKLVGDEVFPDISTTRFRRSSVFEAALLLQAAGERDLAERFMVHLAERLDRSEQGTMAKFVLDLAEPHIALRIAKQSARMGWVIEAAYFPVVELGVDPMPVPLELALAIARRESEFDPGVASGVGARGLMQLMPPTAREVAGNLGIEYSGTRLFTDPTYNATLGTAYLKGLIDRFGSSPILVAAGYNAGPGRPARWIREYGDPRTGAVDVIDWIEHIPFDETRNYVMRVAESLPIYRARISGTPERLHFWQELRGG